MDLPAPFARPDISPDLRGAPYDDIQASVTSTGLTYRRSTTWPKATGKPGFLKTN